MRNGDYNPTRLAAQQDAAQMLANDRSNSNAENTVGVLSMAGHGVEMLVSPTEEMSKILAAFAKIQIGGKVEFGTAVQIAQLALKHRKNKNGGQRIIVFAGSPVSEDTQALVKIGKQLKKNNVAVDVVSMGEIPGNDDKLREFVNATNSGDNCHFLSVAPGVSLTDALSSSPLLQFGSGFGGGTLQGSSAAAGASAGAGGAFEEYGGIDPSLDPELAMAIRVSTEEARARAQAGSAAQGGTAGTATAAAPSGTSAGVAAEGAHTAGGEEPEEDEEELMRRALELSMLEIQSPAATPASSSGAGGVPAATAPVQHAQHAGGGEGDEDEEEAMRLALQMSVENKGAAGGKAEAKPTAAAGGSTNPEFVDQEFIHQLLGSVDVDLNDPLIQAALAQFQEQQKQGGAAGGATSSNSNQDSSKEDDSKKRKRDEEKDAKK